MKFPYKINFYGIFIFTFVVFTLISASPAKQEKPSKKDDSRDKKIEELISKMTIEEKVGQLNFLVAGVVTGPTATPADPAKFTSLIKENKVGGFFNTYGADFTRQLQKVAVENTTHKIPLIFGADIIHGFRTIFPIPLGQAASWDMAEIERAERVATVEATAVGIHWNFAPMIDISRDPRWGRIAEGSGEDPYLGSMIAKARIYGMQGKDLSADNTMAACAKHFIAYGAAESGRDYNVADMSERTLRDIYLPPFIASIEAGVATMMPSFNEIDGMPATGNKFMLDSVLRKELGFEGLLVSDYGAINEMVNHGVAADSKEAAKLAIKAGVDMDMESYAYLTQLPQLIKEGKVNIETLNESVRRVLRLKYDLGLFDDPYKYSNASREKKEILAKDHLEAARTMAKKSIVLLKNENNLLPLSKDVKSIAVIGPLGDNKKELNGTWSFFGNENDPVSIIEGIKQKVSKNTKVLFAKGCEINTASTELFDEAIKTAENSDVVIMAVGEDASMSGEAASRATLDIPGVQLELIKAIHKTGKPIVVLLTSGRPLTINWVDENVPAILETWFLGTQTGNAIADVLFGDYNPSGKLPVTFPRSVGQVPFYYNHKNTGRPYDESKDPNNTWKYASRFIDVSNTPLYPFGYGLSYTTFEYSDIQLDKKQINPSEKIKVSVNVKNTGKVAGEEVVQLYIRDVVGSVTRPVKELKGFRKISLQPGETQAVAFEISANDLAFYNLDMTWGAEPGEFKVFVGTDSQNVKEAGFTLIK
ncbi:MAG TPA: glycoside hydrolase family 3 N-terminal domain-containing protein [Cytophagales bacterium]|nr:glycoside hydrolase family 3 N-terminal domain-containing protein [Cytophagales bacterium]